MFLCVLFGFSLIYTISSQCQILINELNIDSPKIGEENEYIELVSNNCEYSETPSLNDYMVIIIKEYDKISKKPVIVFSADLHGTSFSSNAHYFVIGSKTDFVNPQLSFDDEAVRYKTKHGTTLQIDLDIDPGNRNLRDVLQNGNKYPMGLILLKQHAGKQDIRKLMMPVKKIPPKNKALISELIITDELETIIRNNLVDMFVYSRRTFIKSCTFFNRLSSYKSHVAYNIGSEYDVENHDDVSINRCVTSSDGTNIILMYTTFKIGARTPNHLNDCSGFHFILFDSIETIVDSSKCCSSEISTANVVPEVCATSNSNIKIQQVPSHLIANYRDCKLKKARRKSDTTDGLCSCPNVASNFDLYNEAADLESQIVANCVTDTGLKEPSCTSFHQSNAQNSAKSNEQDLSVYKPWEDVTLFKDEWTKQILQHQGRYIATTLLKQENKQWLEYLFDVQNPQISKFRCRICLSYLKKRESTMKNIPLLATTNGYFVANYKTMWKQINTHPKSSVHENAVQFMQKEYVDTLKGKLLDVKKAISSEIGAQHMPTVKMIRTVFASIKLNIPFSNHPDIVSLQKLNGIEMGSHHNDANSATRIAESISENMHNNLIKSLNENKFPFSLIVDTSTDASNQNFLVIFIRTVESNYPMMYFYRCLHIKTESSINLFSVVISALEEDNLLTNFIDNAYGFASDGAPVMLGHRGGLSKLLNDRTTNNLYNIHCMAHKLQLTIGHGFDEADDLKNHLDNFINSIYSFYYDKSFKRKQLLIKTAEELGLRFRELHYIHSIRWVDSQLLALETFYKLYKSIMDNMLLIMDSPDFSNDIKSKAKGYSNTMSQGRFLTTILFSMDVLKILKRYSKIFQLSQSSVIGIEGLRVKLYNELLNVKVNNGPYIQMLLRKGKCHKNFIWTNCNLRDIDSNDFKFPFEEGEVTFTTRPIRNTANNIWPILSKLRQQLIDALLSKLNTYFPEGTLEIFEILNPSKFDTNIEHLPNFVQGIVPLATRFNLNSDLVKVQFSNALKSIISDHSDLFCTYKDNDDYVQFWSTFLRIETIEWGKDFRKLVYIVLSLPLGSADIERCFSIMNNFKTNKRSRLSVKHIEDIARIQINGPSISDFDATIYTLKWLTTNHIKSDDNRLPHKKREVEVYKRKSALF